MHQMFLFGAGASAFYKRSPADSPPLGKDLFAKLEPHLRCRPDIPEDIRSKFSPYFEEGMDALWRHNGAMIQSFTQDMAKYFASFSPERGNYYEQLVNHLRNKGAQAWLATLNYDLLLDQTLEQLGIPYTQDPTKATASKKLIFKLHGSCNLVPDMGGGSVENMVMTMEPRSIDDEPLSMWAIVDESGNTHPPGMRALSPKELLEFLSDSQAMVPCMAAYHESKTVRDCAHAIRSVIHAWQDALSRSENLFIVGVGLALQDKHIWDPIRSFRGRVHWVGPEEGARKAQAWAIEAGLDFIHFAPTFEAFIPEYYKHFVAKP